VVQILRHRLQVRHHDFITFDDKLYVTGNSLGRAHPGGHIQAFTTFSAGNWNPLTWLSLRLDYWPQGRIAGLTHLPGSGNGTLPSPRLLPKTRWWLLQEKIPLLALAAAEQHVLRACEQAIDLANHLIRQHKLGIPTSSTESFDLLRQQSIIAAPLA
jgi:hypothetical protein